MMLWQKGRRLFVVASILMIVTAVFHTLGQFGPSSGPAETAAINAMKAFHVDFGFGMRPSIFDVFRGLAFTMSITFAAIALLNLIVAASAEVSAALIRRIAWLNIIWVAAFTALTLGYQALPAVISGLIILVFLVASLTANKRR
jgi:hypothetical protein